MSGVSIRPEQPSDAPAIEAVVTRAFGSDDEASLVAALRDAGDVVLSLVAEIDGAVVGHVLFSRLHVVDGHDRFDAVALAPLAVDPSRQNSGLGAALVEHAHALLKERGENLSLVLGEPGYYGRFGYAHDRAAAFDSAYQGDALQAVAWDEAPHHGRLDYAAAFAGLG